MAWFDGFAQEYDAWYATELGRYADRVEKGLLGELAAPQPRERALDIGCGTGNHALWLAEQGLEVTGLDESERMLAEARRKSGDLPVTWVLGSAGDMPFDGGSFDLVLSVTAMEFIEDRSRVLADARRLLRPGGRLVLGLLTRDSAWGQLYAEAGKDAGSVFAPARLFDEDELDDLLPGRHTVRRGLYHPPDPDLDRRAAEVLEGEKQALQAEGAGFLAVRWDKEEVA